jgi:oxygen-dependent protoporphyrinogen oxidase
VSIGRAGAEAGLQRDDAALATQAHEELGELLGAPLPATAASWVQRWGGALPQYAPGHLDRVAAARAALADRPGIALAGAAYDGVGIPACVASGETAAEDLVKSLEDGHD